jgi:hypothetical protein
VTFHDFFERRESGMVYQFGLWVIESAFEDAC